MTDVSDYVYDEGDQFTVPEFFQKYKDRLPSLVVVTGGFCGLTNYDDYSNDQIVRLNQWIKQPRVLGRVVIDPHNPKETFLNIPINEKHKFVLVKSFKEVGEPQNIGKILKENNPPLIVKYVGRTYTYAMQNLVNQHILIIKTFHEIFLQGNSLVDGVLHPTPALMALSPNIWLSVITGYTEKPIETFHRRLKSMEVFVEKNVKFEDAVCKEMTMFGRDDPTTGTGNPVPADLLPDFNEVDDIYEILEPDPDWVPPVPTKRGEKPGLPGRTAEERSVLSTDVYEDVNDETEEDKKYNSSASSTSSYVSDKTVDEICEILNILKLSNYTGVFRENLIDGVLLEECDEHILKESFNFRPIEAVRLMKYVREGHVPK